MSSAKEPSTPEIVATDLQEPSTVGRMVTAGCAVAGSILAGIGIAAITNAIDSKLEGNDSETSDTSPHPPTHRKRPPDQDTSSPEHKRTQCSNVSVEDVIKHITREKLTEGVKKMQTSHRTHILHDDYHLIDDDCRDTILTMLDNGKKTNAANHLIDYFRDNHDGSSLVSFCNFLRCEAKRAGNSPNLMKLSQAIINAVGTLQRQQ